jgi:hypothetical protein
MNDYKEEIIESSERSKKHKNLPGNIKTFSINPSENFHPFSSSLIAHSSQNLFTRHLITKDSTFKPVSCAICR